MAEKQFSFMQGKGTTDAIYALRQRFERYTEIRKNNLAFIEFESALDRIPREEV